MLRNRLRHFFESFAARKGPITLAEALPWIVPKVRPRFVYEALSLRTGMPGPEFRPLAGMFASSLVVDLPDQELDVGAAELQFWNTDFDRLMQQARTNLLARGGEQGFSNGRVRLLRQRGGRKHQYSENKHGNTFHARPPMDVHSIFIG